ncbi:MAG TPA: CheR family methyltransferase [Blastocatellia bacterium]|nr:CheR family methyltransferase [Blastocatellia bacterium]
MNAALKNIEAALTEHYGWSSSPALREKIGAAVEVKAERLRVAPEEYCRIAASSFSEMLALVEEVSLGETWFFREPHQFDHLRDIVFPDLMESGDQGERMRIWSAACSTGEEAYSLAIAFEQSNPPSSQAQGRAQAEVFATDVRNRALMDASQARYKKDSLREVPPQILGRYFERGLDSTEQPDGTHVVIADVRRRVIFRRVNLLERAYWKSMPNQFDLIVCSNLLTFLSSTAARQTVTNLTNSLREGGYLMVSPDEGPLVISRQLRQSKENISFFQRAG